MGMNFNPQALTPDFDFFSVRVPLLVGETYAIQGNPNRTLLVISSEIGTAFQLFFGPFSLTAPRLTIHPQGINTPYEIAFNVWGSIVGREWTLRCTPNQDNYTIGQVIYTPVK